MPFLVQFATKLVVKEKDSSSDLTNPETFHTRCGHPRHIDD
jgi:hypothetical protein